MAIAKISNSTLLSTELLILSGTLSGLMYHGFRCKVIKSDFSFCDKTQIESCNMLWIEGSMDS